MKYQPFTVPEITQECKYETTFRVPYFFHCGDKGMKSGTGLRIVEGLEERWDTVSPLIGRMKEVMREVGKPSNRTPKDTVCRNYFNPEREGDHQSAIRPLFPSRAYPVFF